MSPHPPTITRCDDQPVPVVRMTFWSRSEAAAHRALLACEPAGLLECRAEECTERGGTTFIMTPPTDPDDPFDEAPSTEQGVLPRPILGMDPSEEVAFLWRAAEVLHLAARCGYCSPRCTPSDLLSTEEGTWLIRVRADQTGSPASAANSILSLIAACGGQTLQDALTDLPDREWQSPIALLMALESLTADHTSQPPDTPPSPPSFRFSPAPPPPVLQPPPAPADDDGWLYVAHFIVMLVLSLGMVLVSFQLMS